MAGIFERLIKSQKRYSTHRLDPAALELQTAKEILAEVFGVRLLDVDEMIKNRFETGGSEEGGLWPREFWIEI